MRTERPTGGHDETNRRFHNFANAPAQSIMVAYTTQALPLTAHSTSPYI